MLTYSQRAELCHNPTAKKLLQLMDEKQTNLSVAVDLTRSREILEITKKIGSEICVLKTHIDIVEDFSIEFITQLKYLAKKYNFLIFEDRKFADIGNTVNLQYSKGIYRICEWAEITNAHTVPGPGIIVGLKTAGLPLGNGLLLLAEMSSQGALAQGDYTKKSIAMAQAHKDFVIGFITQKKLCDDPCLINFTPGIHLATKDDQLGQQYHTPTAAIIDNETDVIIVGRGIYQADDPAAAAKLYRQAGWEAYRQRLSFITPY